MRTRAAEQSPAEIPAHDLDVERAVLGATLYDPEALAPVRVLTPEHFWYPPHRVIFRHILALADASGAVDEPALARSLRDSNEFDEVGGAPMLALLGEAGIKAIPAYLPRHCETVRELFAKRETEAAARLLADHARNGHTRSALAAEVRAMAERLEGDDAGPNLEPEIAQDGDDYAATWPARGVALAFSALHDGREGLYAEVVATLRGRELGAGSRVNLSSTRSRSELAKALTTAAPGLPWPALLDAAASAVRRAIRTVPPAVELAVVEVTEKRYLMAPINPLGEPTIECGDGGSGKSFLEDIKALALAHKRPLPHMQPMLQTSTLILDWESFEDDARERLTMAAAGLRCPVSGVYYRRMVGGLAEQASDVRREIERLRVGHIVIDSMVPALGDTRDGLESATVRFYGALRSLGVGLTSSVVAHVSKMEAQRQGPGSSKPYGSVFAYNLARSVWEVRASAEAEGDTLPLALYQTKNNRGPRHPAIGLRLQFTRGAVTLLSGDLRDSSDLLERASPATRIRAVLSRGKATIAAIAEATSIKPDTVEKALKRMPDATRVTATKPFEWGLTTG